MATVASSTCSSLARVFLQQIVCLHTFTYSFMSASQRLSFNKCNARNNPACARVPHWLFRCALVVRSIGNAFVRRSTRCTFLAYLALFLVADTQLYKRLCPSVHWSVGRLVGWLVGPSRSSRKVGKHAFPPLPPVRNWYWPCIRPCFIRLRNKPGFVVFRPI